MRHAVARRFLLAAACAGALSGRASASPSWMAVTGGPADGNGGPYPGKLAGNPALRAKSFEFMVHMGCATFRPYPSDGIEYSWRKCEPVAPVNGVHTYDWRWWDILVREAQAKRIDLIGSTGSGIPEWSNGGVTWKNPPADLWTDPIQNTHLYKFVAALVERYDGDGVADMPGLAKPVKVWSFINEPDLEFNGTVQDTVRYCSIAYAAAKASDPGATVVGPEYACGLDSAATAWNAFKANGGLNAIDIVAYHRYAYERDNNLEYIFAQGSSASCTGGKPTWLTETGYWPGSDGVTADGVRKQARYISRLFTLAFKYPNVQKVFVYSLQETPNNYAATSKGMLVGTEAGPSKGFEPNPQVRQGYLAYKAAAQVVDGLGRSASFTELSGLPGGVRGAKIAEGARALFAFWRNDGQETPVGFVVNLGGGTYTKTSMWGDVLASGVTGSVWVDAGADTVYFTGNAVPAAPYLIAGRVRDSTRPTAVDNGLADVQVSIAGPLNRVAGTDAQGCFCFRDVPVGTYTVRVDPFGPSLTVTTGTANAASSALDFLVAPAAYAQRCASPAFAPLGGIYATPQTVDISAASPGATLRYTTDGSEPTSASPVYAGPITVAASLTLKAKAFRSGIADSVTATAVYIIGRPACPAPAFSPPGGTYAGARSVAISVPLAGATIRYTTDGSDPGANAPAYVAPIPVATSQTLKARAYASGHDPSPVVSATYVIVPANLLSNPGFEAGIAGWDGTAAQEVSVATGSVHGGTQSMKIRVSAVKSTTVSQAVAVKAGRSYAVSAWERTRACAGTVTFKVVFKDANNATVQRFTIGALTGTNDWRQVSGACTAPAGAVKAVVQWTVAVDPDGDGAAWVDDAGVRSQ